MSEEPIPPLVFNWLMDQNPDFARWLQQFRENISDIVIGATSNGRLAFFNDDGDLISKDLDDLVAAGGNLITVADDLSGGVTISLADLYGLIAGTANKITVADDGDGTVTLSLASPTRLGGAANYTEFEADGTMEMNGDATVWEDLRVSLETGKLPASNYPAWTKVADNGSGSVGVFAYSFDDGESIFFSVQLPHAWKEGSTIYPHIHFVTATDVDPADNFGIGLEYLWTDIGEDNAANTSTEIRVVSTGVNSSGQHQIANIPEVGIAGTGHTISSVLLCRLYRYAASPDNYAGAVFITEFDIHYEMDTVGSRGVVSK